MFNNPVYRVKIVVENGLGSCLELFKLWKLKLYKGYINLLFYEIIHHSKVILITCVMKAKENNIYFCYMKKCKVQLNVYKRLFDNEYLIGIHDISSYSCI